MKLNTDNEKMAYLLGYLQAVSEIHADEFKRDVDDVKRELIEGLVYAKKNKI